MSRAFEIDVDEGPGFHGYPIRLRFEGEAVELEVLAQSITGVHALDPWVSYPL